MKKIKQLIWLFALLMLGWTANAQHIQLGSGTGTQYYIPIYSYYDYNYSQVIYTAEEMLAADANASGGSIDAIYYLPSTSKSTDEYHEWEIYMANTTKQGFESTTDWVASADLVKVFDGSIGTDLYADTWLQITLDNPFVWDGTSNVVVAVLEKTPDCTGYSDYPSWRSYTLAPNTGNKGIYKYQDNNLIEPSNPPTASSRSNTVPQIRFEGTNLLASCLVPAGLELTSVSASSAVISWTASTSDPSEGYEIYYGIDNTAPDASANTSTTVGAGVTSVELSGLTDNTTYYVWVRANCGSGDLSVWSNPFSFLTPCFPYTMPYFEGFESGYTDNAEIAGCLVQEGISGSNAWTANSSVTSDNRTPR
ncbi:MAG: hypothetical protein GX879_06280, partial [Bacteroidales bacterium]|nr:hypothetical protein [Bacteroidales bacterium]